MFFNLLNNFFNNNLDFLYFRIFIVLIFSFLFTIIGLHYLIKYLKSHQAFQPIRVEGPEGHVMTKQKTPTMGGSITALALLFSTLLFCDLKNIYVISILVVSMSFSIIGFIDDYIKVFYKNTKGFRGSIKFVLQALISGLAILFLMKNGSYLLDSREVFIPFFHITLYIGILFIPFLLFVILGSSNGVNMTDGLDGLAIIPVIFCSFILSLLLINTNPEIQNHYFINATTDNLSELSILCSAIIGGGIGFFIYNKHPAKIFMGDVGSLMYGSFLGFLVVLLRQELFFAIAGLLFAIEASSTIIQVASYKLFNRRVFKMAPIHHHFEKMGWSESKVVYTFWSFSIICGIIALLGVIKY